MQPAVCQSGHAHLGHVQSVPPKIHQNLDMAFNETKFDIPCQIKAILICRNALVDSEPIYRHSQRTMLKWLVLDITFGNKDC